MNEIIKAKKDGNSTRGIIADGRFLWRKMKIPENLTEEQYEKFRKETCNNCLYRLTKWIDKPCVNCKFNPGRYIKLKSKDNYKEEIRND